MTQKPMLRGEVDARALRVKVYAWVDFLASAVSAMRLGLGYMRGSLWPSKAGSVLSAPFFVV